MHFTSLFETLYVMNALWSKSPSPEVCASSPVARWMAGYGVARPWASDVSGAVTAFVNVNVVPMDTERVLLNQTVVVERGRITALGPMDKVQVPAGAVRLDGRDKYLTPGLADMHAHFLSGENYDQRARRLFSYVANGVTTIRVANAIPPDHERMFRLFETVESLSPRMYTAPMLGQLRADRVAAYVAAVKAAGYEFILLDEKHGGVAALRARGILDSLLRAARRAGLPVALHDHPNTFEDVQVLGVYGGSSEHLEAFWSALGHRLGSGEQQQAGSLAGLPQLAAATQRAGTWITVTMDCLEDSAIWRHGKSNQPPDIAVSRQIVKALHDAGVKLLLGADGDGLPRRAPSGVHNELAALVRAGLTPYQALVTGMHHPAEYFGQSHEVGTVTVGKRADLVLLAGNPLQDIRHTREPVGVMLRGRWLDRAALDQGLLAAPKSWLRLDVAGAIMPRRADEQLKRFNEHVGRFQALTDALEFAPLTEYGAVLQALAAELGAMGAILTSEQRATFDPAVRPWLRWQTRKGYDVTIHGIALTP